MLMSKMARLALRLGACLAIVGSGAACQRLVTPEPVPVPEVPLVITNHDYFDVAVYAVLMDGVRGPRIATVNGFSSRTVHVRKDLLEHASTLVLEVHAVGTAYSWTSPAMSIDSDDVARLDVYTDSNGDLHRCAFYARAM